MKLGMSSASFYGRLETEDAAEHLGEFGLDTCEVFLETFSEYRRSFGELVHARLGGLPCISVHPKGTQFEQDLFAQSPRQRADAMQIFEGICSAGEAIGASYYVLHGPSGVKHPVTITGIRNLHLVYPRMKQVAAAHGIEILWENVSWCACRTAEDVATILSLFPEQRFVFDVKQAFHANQDPMQIVKSMGKHLAHVHCLDWNEKGELVLPGEGVFDYYGLTAYLASIGYHGALILEPYNFQTEDEERVKTSLRYLRKCIAASQGK